MKSLTLGLLGSILAVALTTGASAGPTSVADPATIGAKLPIATNVYYTYTWRNRWVLESYRHRHWHPDAYPRYVIHNHYHYHYSNPCCAVNNSYYQTPTYYAPTYYTPTYYTPTYYVPTYYYTHGW